MEKSELISNLKNERTHLDDLFAEIEENNLTNEIIETKWTLKDVIFHISNYEKEVNIILSKKALIDRPFWKKADDERNKDIYEQTKSKTLVEAKVFAQKTFSELLSLTNTLTQEELNSVFPGMTRQIGEFIVSLTYGHYEEHVSKLKAKFNL